MKTKYQSLLILFISLFSMEAYVSGGPSFSHQSKYYGIYVDSGIRKTLMPGDDGSGMRAKDKRFKEAYKVVVPKLDKLVKDLKKANEFPILLLDNISVRMNTIEGRTGRDHKYRFQFRSNDYVDEKLLQKVKVKLDKIFAEVKNKPKDKLPDWVIEMEKEAKKK